MLKRCTGLFALFALVGSSFVFADDIKTQQSASWEISGGANASAGYDITGGTFGGQGTNDVFIDLSGAFGYFLTPNWEARFTVRTQIVTASVDNSIFTPRAGMVYNFDAHTANSVYLGALAGPSLHAIASSGNNYWLLSYAVFVGKRFAISDHVCWDPEIYLTGNTSATVTSFSGQLWQYPSGLSFAAEPFQLSILF